MSLTSDDSSTGSGETPRGRPFASALCLSRDWRTVADTIGARLASSGGRLGILYTDESFAPHLDEIAEALRERTGVPDWVSAAGYGVIASGEEHFGEPGAVALVADVPPDGYRLFAGGRNAGADLALHEVQWLADAVMPLALAHVDPRHPEAMEAVEGLVTGTGGFLVGGLTAAAGEAPHRADGATGCLSGVAFSPAAVEIATALSQGCTPLGSAHTVTRGKGNLLIELDGRPALDAFVEDIGEELASDLRRVNGRIFAAIPVRGSDTADYTVRNLVGIDPSSKIVAIAEAVPEGGRVLFCRRDRESAVNDMRRMTADLKRRVGNRSIRGGVYISCAARGPEPVCGPRSRDGDYPRLPGRVSDGWVLCQRGAEPGSNLRLYRGIDALSRTRRRQPASIAEGHLNVAEGHDRTGTCITAEPLGAEAFAPFGDVVDASGQPDRLINSGACGRFDDRARLSVDSAGRLGVSVFNSRCYTLPVTVEFLERHPLASQAFLPMSADSFLVVVAPNQDGTPGAPRAFVTREGQGVNLLRGTWHGVLTPLGSSGLFAVIDRIGPGENCDVHHLEAPITVESAL